MMDAFELPTTLVQALRRRAVQEPERLALRFLAEDDGEGVVLSYRDLDLRARSIAAALQAHAQLGDRAVLLFPSGPDYVAAFFGCLYAGVIAVPAYPPESARRHHQERLLSIIADAEPRLVLTTADLREPLLQMNAQLSAANAPQLLCVDQLDPAVAEAWDEPQVRPEHIAFLQYTSGSTALPKGVQVSHGNLVANEVLIRRGFGIGADDVIVSWLPLYHDMGLIGGLLQPIFSGVPCVLMSPRYFLERPVRWLEAISQYGGTVSGGPDFAYRLCSERVAESALERLDLSGWRVAFSGSEPIRQDSLERFAEKFAASRFEASSFFACYGLAEATLFVTGGQRGQGIPALAVDGEALARNRIAEGAGSVLMCCGRSQPEHAVLIVDAASGEVLGDDNVGEIWAAGPSIAHGYWRNPEASAKTFVERDGRTWLRTGDLGFLRDGELFVTGRLKDMLIVRGHNLYPQDIERTVESEVPSARKGRVAAFAVTVDGEEGIGIAAEIGRGVQKSVPAQELIDSIRQAVAEAYQEAPKVVALLNPGALPKTSSGKLQRSACRLRLEDGSLDSYALFPRPPGRAGSAAAGRRRRTAGTHRRDLEGPAGRGAGSAARSLLPARWQLHRRRPGGRPGARQSRRRPRPAPTVRGADPAGLQRHGGPPTGRRPAGRGTDGAPAARCRPAAVGGAAASLADLADRPAERRLQHPRRPAPARRAGRGGAARQLPAPGRTPRSAAHAFPRARRRSLAAYRRAGRVRLAVRRPRRAGRART
ncbi:peptide synthase [Pseudomonas aeruginosa]|nr:peptide synthase [Pseudomonas aeruginosa]